jgi:AraC-like DNA-binding protein
MALFMDRHNVPGVTAEQVAEAHQKDLEIQKKYGCRVLTYWFDEQSGMAFCLIDAPSRDALVNMHNDAHGLVPNQIIQVDDNLINSFLGRITDPETRGNGGAFREIINESGFRTILFIEYKDPVSLIIKKGKDRYSVLFKECSELIDRILKKFNGRKIIDRNYDNVASFVSIADAIECALEIQEKMKSPYDKSSLIRVDAAIGISLGAPVSENNMVFGETVKLSKRLASAAKEGQIFLASGLRDFYKKQSLNYFKKSKSIKMLDVIEEKFLSNLLDALEILLEKPGFNINDLIKEVGMSRSQLYRKISSLTGYSPNDFIREFKLKKALELMENRQWNISQVAFESGFNSSSYFSKCFQNKYNILPSDYLNALL